LLYVGHVFGHVRPTIKPFKYCSAAVLGWSIARGWVQLILLVILVAGGLILRRWVLYFDVVWMRVCRGSNTNQKAQQRIISENCLKMNPRETCNKLGFFWKTC
jgi:hypothetical protein